MWLLRISEWAFAHCLRLRSRRRARCNSCAVLLGDTSLTVSVTGNWPCSSSLKSPLHIFCAPRLRRNQSLVEAARAGIFFLEAGRR
eukprot:6228400-Alexandrium_andersonii.AAC.1